MSSFNLAYIRLPSGEEHLLIHPKCAGRPKKSF